MGDEHPPQAPAKSGADQIVNSDELQKVPPRVPEYYDLNSPPDSRHNLVAAIGNKVRPITDNYLNKPIPEEFVDKSTLWAEGAKQEYNERIRNTLENSEKLKEKLSTQSLTIIDEMFPAYLTGPSDNEGDKHLFARSPKDTTYANSVLTQQDKRNGYILEERWGVKYRVKQSTKELHPQDKPKFQRRAVEELNEAGAAFEGMAGSAASINITPEGDFTQEANNTEKISGFSEKASDASKPSLNVNAGTNGTARSSKLMFEFPPLDVYGKRIYTWKFLGVEFSTEDIHQFLDWISWVPGVSVVAGGTDATIYFTEGKRSEALMAAFQMIPGSKLFRLGGKAFKVILPLEKLTDSEPKIAKESNNAEPSLLGAGKLYASAASDMLTYSAEDGDPIVGDDMFSMWRLTIFGQDNSELANNQWKDFMYKKMLTGLASWEQLVTKVLGPAGVPLDFGLEVEKNMYKNYDNPQYDYKQGILDTAISKGIDLGTDYSAQGISTALAKTFNLSEPVRWVLEKFLSQTLKEAVDNFK